MKEQSLREEHEDDLPDSQNFRRKPQIAEVSASSLIESMAVHRNLQQFPILTFLKEPVSHPTSREVNNA